MGEISTATFEVVELPIELVHGAEWNANRVPKDVMGKIRRSMTEFGIVENSVVRTLPTLCPYCGITTETAHYEVLSGNHRRMIYEDAGRPTIPCVIRDMSDGKARVFADMLNRTRGQNDPDAHRIALEEALAELDLSYIAGLLPETEEEIQRIVADLPSPADASGYGETQLYGVVVTCKDEAEQSGLLEQLSLEGYDVRALML